MALFYGYGFGRFFDPTYFLVIIGVVLTLLASARVQATFAKYSKVRSLSGYTGAQAAERILRNAGIYDVSVQRVSGNLTDHYDPRSKVLKLSDSVYGSTSVAAIGVAAHECGHAIQHSKDYAPLKIRGALVPVANFGSMLSWPLIIIGVMMSWSETLITIGIILFSAAVLFQIITLPVEFNASSRAIRVLADTGILQSDEVKHTRKVLGAAALTYVAGAAASILQLLRLIILFEGIEIVTKGVDIRELALTILLEISEEGGFSHIALNQALTKYQYLPKQDRAFLSRLTEGTIERMIELDYIINQFSKIKVKKMKPVIRNILRMGAYQIKYMDQVPVSAACNEAVKLAEKKKFKDLKGFVNGVLRTISRELGNVNYPNRKMQPIQYLSVVYSMPEWIITNWLKELDFDTIEGMLKASFEGKAITIRCNTCKIAVDDFKTLLTDQKVTVHPGAYVEEALRISDYDSISRLQGYQEGYFQVQDESSMLVAYAADVREGHTVLDVCAAPGGKSLHIAQQLNGTGKVIACDLTENKVEIIDENLKRLGFQNVETRVQDALESNEEFIGKADVVIADLPCSGLGIIGKKNDIKYKTTPEKQQELAKLQRNILSNVQQYVKKGGALIYSTCTVNQEENLRNVEWFTENFDFVLEPLNNYLPLPFLKRERKDSTVMKGYINLIPGIHETDGFFIARLKRKN